jgi:hypothetical protein
VKSSLSPETFVLLRQELTSRIILLSQIKESILIEAQKIISQVEAACKIAINGIEKNISEYVKYSLKNSYSFNDCVAVQGILGTRIKAVSNAQVVNLTAVKIPTIFQNLFVVERELKSGIYAEKLDSLEERINFCMQIKLEGFEKFMVKKENIKEIRFSRDGDYVFLCII